MSLKDRITEDMKDAMRAKDSERLGTIRLLLSAMKQREVDERIVLSDADVVAIVDKLIKQRKDSIEQFVAGGRPELAEGEKAELAIIEEMLPAQMSREEIEKAAKEKAASLGVTDKTKANQLMGSLMKDLKGKADGTLVKSVVDSLFS